MAKILINDGYTVSGKTPGDLKYPIVNFKYRPAMPERVYNYFRAKKETGTDTMDEVAKLLVERLVEWDVDAESGPGPAPITIEVIKKVPEPILAYLVDVVCGYRPQQWADDAKN